MTNSTIISNSSVNSKKSLLAGSSLDQVNLDVAATAALKTTTLASAQVSTPAASPLASAAFVVAPSLTITSTNVIEDQNAVDGTNVSGAFTGSYSGISFNQTFTDADDSLVNGALKFNLPISYTGSLPLTYTATQTVPVNGHNFTITNNNDGTFSLDKTQFKYLATGQAVVVPVSITVTDGFLSAAGTTFVTIVGVNDAPTISSISFIDDEDGINGVLNNSTQTNTKLIFGFSGADVDGDALTYQIQTGTFTSGGQTYTVASTAIAGTYTVTNNGQTFTVKALAGGKFEYLTSEFQYLNVGQTKVLALQYKANDGHGGVSTAAVATVTIQGTNDLPSVTSVSYHEDEKGLNGTAPDSTLESGKMIFNFGTVTDVDNASGHTFQIQTGTFTLGGQTFTVASTATAGTYTVTNDGKTFTLKNLGNGKFEYQPNEFSYLKSNELKVLVFNYKAIDSNTGASANATATVTIHGTNDAPVVWDVCKQDDEDGNPTFAPNDGVHYPLPNGHWNVKFDFVGSDADGDNLTYSIQSGTFTTPDGHSYQVTPNVWGWTAAIKDLATNETFYIKTLGDGSFYVSTFGLQYLNDGEFREFAFRFKATDSSGATSNTAIYKVKIWGMNDNAVACDFVAQDDERGDENSATTLGLPYNDTEVADKLVFKVHGYDPENDSYVVKFQLCTYQTANGQTYTVTHISGNDYSITNNGKTFNFTYNPATQNIEFDKTQFKYLNAGEIKELQFKFTANDVNHPNGTTNPGGATGDYVATATIKIHGVNDPLIAGNQDFVDDEDAIDGTGATAIVGGVLKTDLNDGVPGILCFTLTNFTNDTGVVATISTGTSPTLTGSDGFAYSVTHDGANIIFDKAQFQHLGVGEFVTFTFPYTITAAGSTATATATVTIIGTNDGLDAVDDNAGTISDGDSVTLNILGNDTDTDGDDLDVSSINSLIINGVAIPSAQWSQYFTINPITGQLVFNSANMNVPAGEIQNVVINYTATDNHGATDSANVFIKVEGPKDVTYGDNQNDGISVITTPVNVVDTAGITATTVADQVKNYMDNTIVKHNADVYGDLGNLNLSVTAGNATAHANPLLEGGTEYALANTDATLNHNTFNFGNDTVTVDNGLVVGDVGNLTLFGHQGNADATYDTNCFDPFAKATANVAITNNIFNFGYDNLKVGNGTVIGDVQKLTFTYENGTATGNGITVDNDNWNFGNQFNFGNDTIEAANGTVTGDIATAVVNGVTYDLSVASQLAAFQATTAYTANTFNFGSDTFVFNVNTLDNVSITDFGIGGANDTLKVTGLSDVNGGGVSISDLVARSAIVNDSGHIKLNIDFNNDGVVDGTISFLNIVFDSNKLEITDYLVSGSIIATA